MKTVLVTGVGGASGLYTAKILKESGYLVVGTDCSQYAAGKAIVDKFYKISPASFFIKTRDQLSNIVTSEKVDVSLPNVDDELCMFAIYQASLKAFISPMNTIEICTDKWKFYSYLQKDVLMPRTALLPCYFKVTGNKYFVKPIVGRGSKNTHIVLLENMDTFLRYIDEVDNFLVQEYIDGEEYTVDILYDRSGYPLVVAPRKRLVVKGGLSNVGKSVRCWNELSKIIMTISSKLLFCGPVNMQFIINDYGTYLTEVNPRLSGGIGITYANGVNIPDLAVRIFLGGKLEGTLPELQEDIVYRVLEEKKCTL